MIQPRFTAVFSDAGLEFRPKGSDASWQWRLQSVGSPSRSIDILNVPPEWGADSLIRYDRGFLVEQYVIDTQTIEQQFVIPAPLDLDSNDLVISGVVQSSMSFETTDDGWLWRKAAAGVSLGHVFVFDAAGRRISASMEVSQAQTRILIDAAALRDALYPVLVDPEIGTNDLRISDMGPDGDAAFGAFQPQIAYNSTDNEYLVVWLGDDDTGALVDGEFEIFGQRINAATGAKLGSVIRISDMGPDGDPSFGAHSTPAVAYNSTNNE